MSHFLLPRLEKLAPYVPGEQPQDRAYIKLNTNENPYAPSPKVLEAIRQNASTLNRYPDPTALRLRAALAKEHGICMENVMVGNGSDEVLAFAFMAYADEEHPATFPTVSYGFYKIFAKLFRAQPHMIPLNGDFSIPVDRFCHAGKAVVLANPNAPTSLAMPLADIRRIVESNPQHPVLVDEAYIDFGGESALPLLTQYPNLLIVRTFSKSRSLAGGRLGYALASEAMIQDLQRVKDSFNPYSINTLTLQAGIAALEDPAYFQDCVERIRVQRDQTAQELRALGFEVLPSATNFLFAKPPKLGGEAYYLRLKARGVLVRYFAAPTLEAHVRISIGTPEEMAELVRITKELVKEETP